MLRRVSGIVVAAVFAVLAPLAAESVRTTSRLNLRQEPSTSSARVELLEVGRTLEVIQRRGVWLRVKAGELEGWVHSEYVEDSALAQTGAGSERDPARVARDAALAREVALLRVRKLEADLAALRAGSESGVESENITLRVRVEALEAELAQSARQMSELEAELVG